MFYWMTPVLRYRDMRPKLQYFLLFFFNILVSVVDCINTVNIIYLRFVKHLL